MKILAYPNEALTTPCEPVTEFDQELHALLDTMAELMNAEHGLGLAANQVGVLKQAFIMADSKGKIYEFINPVLSDPEGHLAINEGCLSAPGAFVQVARAQTITVKAQDRTGEFFTVVCQDLEAICVQHEYDHLQGVFYLDRTSRQQRRHALKSLGLK